MRSPLVRLFALLLALAVPVASVHCACAELVDAGPKQQTRTSGAGHGCCPEDSHGSGTPDCGCSRSVNVVVKTEGVRGLDPVTTWLDLPAFAVSAAARCPAGGTRIERLPHADESPPGAVASLAPCIPRAPPLSS